MRKREWLSTLMLAGLCGSPKWASAQGVTPIPWFSCPNYLATQSRTDVLVADGANGNNAGPYTQCYNPPPGSKFVEGSGKPYIVQDTQNEHLPPQNDRSVSLTNGQMCLTITARPSKSYSHANISACVEATTVPQ
jgi:hypothetical protein